MKYFLKPLAKILAGAVALVVVLLIGLSFVPVYTQSVQIDFTRYLSANEPGDGGADSFFGVPGSARLIVSGAENAAGTTIELNGTVVAGPDKFDGASEFEIPVELIEDNTISLTVNGAPGSQILLRVKQLADLELHVQSRIHFNNNVSDFVAARAFYGKLGFQTLSEFPDTNTQEMARAIGIETPTSYDGSKGDHPGGYLLHGEIIGMSAFSAGVIDLIEFTTPRNDEPPYAKVNHLGMAKAAMYTTNIAADYAYMKDIGVDFLSAPVTRSDGTTFAISKDLDGVFYELIEVDGEAGDDAETETTHITGLGHLNINVSDFERSRAWYQMMGYDISRKLASTEPIDVAKAMGFDAPFEIDGAILAHNNDASTVELVQWITPHDPERAYPIPVNHFGMHRTAFLTSDMEADVATLRAQGVEFLSPITPCCSGNDSASSIIAFYDPDGTIVELATAPVFHKVMTVIKWFSD